MKITVNIETQNPEDLMRVAQALAGVMPAADPSPAAATKARGASKGVAEAREIPGVKEANPTASEPAKQATEASSAASASTVSGATTSSSGPTATTAASPSDAPAAEITDADLNAALNLAAAAMGAAGPAKITAYCKDKYLKEDGQPGTPMKVRKDQRPMWLNDLQRIAKKELVL